MVQIEGFEKTGPKMMGPKKTGPKRRVEIDGSKWTGQNTWVQIDRPK